MLDLQAPSLLPIPIRRNGFLLAYVPRPIASVDTAAPGAHGPGARGTCTADGKAWGAAALLVGELELDRKPAKALTAKERERVLAHLAQVEARVKLVACAPTRTAPGR